jgi:hypothetical protein
VESTCISYLIRVCGARAIQRLAIHRVAAFYTLQSAVINEDPNSGRGKVVVRKTPYTKLPKVWARMNLIM